MFYWTLSYGQIEKLKSETEEQNRRREDLETQAGEAEKKIWELSSKLEKVITLYRVIGDIVYISDYKLLLCILTS